MITVDLGFSLVSDAYELYKQVPVTPVIAEILLKEHGDPRRRNLRSRKVEAYARDMLNDNWLPNGHAVGFAQDGRLQRHPTCSCRHSP